MTRDGLSFFRQVIETKRTMPGRFYLAAAALVFIVLYLSISIGAGRIPDRGAAKEADVQAMEKALRSHSWGQPQR